MNMAAREVAGSDARCVPFRTRRNKPDSEETRSAPTRPRSIFDDDYTAPPVTRKPARAPDMFSAWNEDRLASQMQHLDGVVDHRFPPKVACKETAATAAKLRKPRESSFIPLAEKCAEYIAEHGPCGVSDLAAVMGVKGANISCAMQLLRERRTAVYDASKRAWVLL